MNRLDDCASDCRMSAAEFREARQRLGLSVSKLAYRLGVSSRTIRRWQSGDDDIPGPTAVAMRSFLREAA